MKSWSFQYFAASDKLLQFDEAGSSRCNAEHKSSSFRASCFLPEAFHLICLRIFVQGFRVIFCRGCTQWVAGGSFLVWRTLITPHKPRRWFWEVWSAFQFLPHDVSLNWTPERSLRILCSSGQQWLIQRTFFQNIHSGHPDSGDLFVILNAEPDALIPLKHILQGAPLLLAAFVGQDVATFYFEALIDLDHALQCFLPLLVIFLLD